MYQLNNKKYLSGEELFFLKDELLNTCKKQGINVWLNVDNDGFIFDAFSVARYIRNINLESND